MGLRNLTERNTEKEELIKMKKQAETVIETINKQIELMERKERGEEVSEDEEIGLLAELIAFTITQGMLR